MINFMKNDLILNQTFPKLNDTFFIEGDVIIPDIKPDVESVLYVDALPVIEDYSVNSGQITVSGNCEFNVLYVPEALPNEIIRISTSIPFKNSFAVPNLTQESCIDLTVFPAKVSSLILNGRKLSISAELTISLNFSNRCDVTYIESLEENNSIMQLSSNHTIPVFVTSLEKTTLVKDTAMLETSQPNINDILKYDAGLSEQEVMLSDNKLLIKGNLDIVVYYTSENSSEIYTFKATIPYTDFIDIKNIPEDSEFDISNKIKSLSLKLMEDSDNLLRVIEFDAVIESKIQVSANSEINVIEDVYDTQTDLIPEIQNVTYEKTSSPIAQQIMFRGAISIPENDEIKVLSVFGRIKNIELNNTDSSMLTGKIDVTVIYKVLSNGKINSVSLDMPMEHVLSEKIDTLNDAIISEIELTPSGNNQFDVKINMNSVGNRISSDNVALLKNIVDMENKTMSNKGLTIYFVKPGDTMWKIAKKFHTTIEHISEINNIQNPDVIDTGKTLII